MQLTHPSLRFTHYQLCHIGEAVFSNPWPGRMRRPLVSQTLGLAGVSLSLPYSVSLDRGWRGSGESINEVWDPNILTYKISFSICGVFSSWVEFTWMQDDITPVLSDLTGQLPTIGLTGLSVCGPVCVGRKGLHCLSRWSHVEVKDSTCFLNSLQHGFLI